ncbi:MAG: hypothetical protein Q7K39_03825 [Candidatus Magasanikbacteria bacterium]|nr:hypothetical protein [Candidatus Magasanikbacteria bacterium]
MKKQLKAFLRKQAEVSSATLAFREKLAPLAVCAVGVVKNELVKFKKMDQPIIAYHATTATGAQKILAKGLEVRVILGQRQAQTPAVFLFVDLKLAKIFSLFCRWPFRLLFDFRSEPKNIILEVMVPAGTRIGITSWHEVVSPDPILPENINLLGPNRA